MTDSQDTNKQQQEPMAVHQFRKSGCSDWYDGIPDDRQRPWLYEVRTLYTSPQSKPWVGLTDEVLQKHWPKVWPAQGAFVRASADDLREFAHGIKGDA